MQSPAFHQYFEMSEKWLRPYAVFKVLQNLFGTAEHWHWGALSRPTSRVSALLGHCILLYYSTGLQQLFVLGCWL